MSQGTNVQLLKLPYRRALVNNSTDANYQLTIAPTTTKPTTSDSSSSPATNYFVGPLSGSELHILPFGINAANEQFQIRVNFWRSIINAAGGTASTLWTPHQVGSFDITVGTAVGAVGATVLDTEFFADIITETGSTWDDTIVQAIISQANILTEIKLNTQGWELFSVEFDIDILATDAAEANFAYTSV